jgi:hypothetical protein
MDRFWGILLIMAGIVLVRALYLESKKTRTETFFYNAFEDIAEDELEADLI